MAGPFHPDGSQASDVVGSPYRRSPGAFKFHKAKSIASDPDIEFILAFAASGCMHLATNSAEFVQRSAAK